MNQIAFSLIDYFYINSAFHVENTLQRHSAGVEGGATPVSRLNGAVKSVCCKAASSSC